MKQEPKESLRILERMTRESRARLNRNRMWDLERMDPRTAEGQSAGAEKPSNRQCRTAAAMMSDDAG